MEKGHPVSITARQMYQMYCKYATRSYKTQGTRHIKNVQSWLMCCSGRVFYPLIRDSHSPMRFCSIPGISLECNQSSIKFCLFEQRKEQKLLSFITLVAVTRELHPTVTIVLAASLYIRIKCHRISWIGANISNLSSNRHVIRGVSPPGATFPELNRTNVGVMFHFYGLWHEHWTYRAIHLHILGKQRKKLQSF